MKSFEKLETEELIDLLAKYSSSYSKLKREMGSVAELSKYRSLVQTLMEEIQRRQRSTIGPYNDISQERLDDLRTA